MSEMSQEETQDSQESDINNELLDVNLRDPSMKARLLQKMGLDDGGDRTSLSKGLENTSSVSNANLAPSGKSVGSWPLIGSHPTCLPSDRSDQVPPGFFSMPEFYGYLLIQPGSSVVQIMQIGPSRLERN